MVKYNLVAENPESTVVSDYRAEYRTEKEYQSEAELERAFIALLKGQAYEYLPIHNEMELVANLRRQLEKLNGYNFTNGEWSRFFTGLYRQQKQRNRRKDCHHSGRSCAAADARRRNGQEYLLAR